MASDAEKIKSEEATSYFMATVWEYFGLNVQYDEEDKKTFQNKLQSANTVSPLSAT